MIKQTNSNHDSIELGIIGLGEIAEYQLKAIKILDNFHLIAGCDLNPIRARILPMQVPFYSNFTEFANNPNIKNVLISTPPNTHFYIAVNMLKAGKNVLVEKPATKNIIEFNRLCKIASKSHSIIVTSLHARFGKEILWFEKEYKTTLKSHLGEISSFFCEFYDPYVINGVLDKNKTALGDPWIDSGINALSVVTPFVSIDTLRLINKESKRIPQVKGKIIQTKVEYSFSVNKFDSAGYGYINIDWTLGLNQKTTRLHFKNTHLQILLHHSNQQVILLDSSNETILADFSDDGIRLVNHYIGVFNDFAQRVKLGDDNLQLSEKLHKLFFR